MKKFLAMALALLMVAVLLPITAMAEDRVALGTITADANGTYDASSAHVTYEYYTDSDKMCWPANSTVAGGTTGGTLPWVKTVTITGVEFSELSDGSSDMKLLAKIIMNGRRTDTSAQFKDSIEVKFINCSFKQTTTHLQVYKICPCNVTKYTFQNCEFNQAATGQYALTLNASETGFGRRPISYEITGCTINAAERGINIIAGTETEAIGTSLPTVNISNNTITIANTSGVKNNAFQIAGDWENANLTAAGNELIKISGNTITAYAAVRVHGSLTGESAKYVARFDNNTLKGNTKKAVADGSAALTKAIMEIYDEQLTPRTITIIIPSTPTSPEFLSGANQTVGVGAKATFRIDKDFVDFMSVAVDGITLDKTQYKAWSGSTYVELLSSYMKTLSEGTHTLSAYFNGATATTAFTISKTVPAQQNPATGANDFVGAAAALAVVSLLGMAVASRKK